MTPPNLLFSMGRLRFSLPGHTEHGWGILILALRAHDGLRRQRGGGRQCTSPAGRTAGLCRMSPSTQGGGEPLWSPVQRAIGSSKPPHGVGCSGGDHLWSELKPITSQFQPGYLGKALLVSPPTLFPPDGILPRGGEGLFLETSILGWNAGIKILPSFKENMPNDI